MRRRALEMTRVCVCVCVCVCVAYGSRRFTPRRRVTVFVVFRASCFVALGEAPPAHEKVPHEWKSLGESRAELIAALSEGPSLDEETEVSSWKEAADKLTGE